MSVIMEDTLPFNEGEMAMHQKLNVPPRENPTTPFLTPYGAYMLSTAPLLSMGALDTEGRPWSTVWGGEAGFAGLLGKNVVGMRALVDRAYDPVVQALLGETADGTVIKADKMLSGVSIDLENRTRVKLHGRMVLGTLTDAEDNEAPSDVAGSRGKMQLVVKIDESLGNCPKYLNKKHIIPAVPEPRLISDSPQLPPQAIELLSRADCMFISSSHNNIDMDTNYRGGPSGFVRVISNTSDGAVLVYPEYSGNRLYQSLGNMVINHRAGIVFPDFETGNALYITATTEIFIGEDADAILPRSNLVIKMTVVGARFVQKALAFRGVPGEQSPYTPPMRYLRNEKADIISSAEQTNSIMAKVIQKEILNPSTARFRFRLLSPTNLPKYKPGQYAIFSFKDELDLGYSHMRDDDPLSLNDDLIRTFTVSSFPGHGLPDNEFEITVRKNRKVTSHLFQWNPRTDLEVPMMGFGGSFHIDKNSKDTLIPFIAGGIGITPLLGQLPGLDMSRLRLFWSVSISDIGLVQDTFDRFPNLPSSTTLFITQTDIIENNAMKNELISILKSGAIVRRRRIEAKDLDVFADTFYLCAGSTLRASVLGWLKGKNVIYENFTY
ncbi:putative oxidoreductase [Talaromyces proteolyticus]|uniref:Oxidoreductase n=1 Tax=Talaromyces proteolyticus TaxID=1131652 RepID=A0AAD4Q5V7_9EURO|nr:putative oxidoreductase [Talaromyces proteolyticus]KAH8705026.1 putative oxidoreductase [Talaromyces proteolyticus]